MPDLVDSLLPRLHAHRLPGLDLGPGLIYPYYHGKSILNLPASVCKLLGVPPLHGEPFDEAILDPLLKAREGAAYRRVILILMDALALHRFQRWLANGSLGVWESMIQRGVFAPLTSITPSTTAAALTALWTGRSTYEHGILGYEMWLKEYSVIANTITHSPITFRDGGGSLSTAGFKPREFLNLPTMGTHLAKHGVKTYARQHYTISQSGLSEMFFKDVDVQSVSTAADLWVSLRKSLEANPTEKSYTWVYWSDVDHNAHLFGPEDERGEAEFVLFSTAMEKFFLERLSPQVRQDTLLCLAADHGMIHTRKDPHYELKNHPSLTRRLHMMPSGENRLAYFFIRPGQVEAVREYLERTWPNQFSIIDPVYAAQTGLFGSGEMHPRLYERLGDILVIAHGDAYLWWHEKENILIGRHGGLHPEEMLVPFVGMSLDTLGDE